jgi:hypothetical protein
MLSTTDLQTLKCAWKSRKTRVELDTYGDLLFEVIRAELPDPTEVLNNLMDCVQYAQRPSDIRMPLWSYRTRYWTKPRTFDTDQEEEDASMIHRRGWHWTVGTNQRAHKPMDLIVKKTDLLPRLAALYGPCFHCTRGNVLWYSTDRYDVTETTIWLVYTPREQPAPFDRLRYTLQDGETVETDRGDLPETPPPSPRGEEPPPLKRACYCHFKTDS